MRLVEIFREFEASLNQVKGLQSELQQQMQQEAITKKLNAAFERLESSLQNKMEALIQSKMSEVKQELNATMQHSLQNMFLQNLEEVAVAIKNTLNKTDIVIQVATLFVRDQEERIFQSLLKLFTQGLGSKYTAQMEQRSKSLLKTFKENEEQFLHLCSEKMNHLQTFPIEQELQALCRELINNNKEEIFKAQDLSVLKNALLQSTQQSIQNTAREVILEFLTQNAQEFVTTSLKHKAKEVFQEVYQMQEVKEAKALASLHLQSVSLQSELDIINSALMRLNSLKNAKKGVNHNTLKVV